MSQEWQSYFSADAATTQVSTDVSNNASDVSTLLTPYQSAIPALFSALESAKATAIATPTAGNLNAVVTARQNMDIQRIPNAEAATLADQIVNGPTGTIMTRTTADVVAALKNAVTKLNTAVTTTIGYGSGVTVVNAALRDRLAVQIGVANIFINQSSSWKKPADLQPAIDWLLN